MRSFETKVMAYAKAKGLLSFGRKYLVALSGGADSVALTRVLAAVGIEVECAHCNFHLRGEESDRDEQFCVDFCNKLGLPLHRSHFMTEEYAAVHHVSIEMAARDLRYGWFRRLRHGIGAEAICVAHHRDDNVETVIMNLVRGTGVHGLRGILPKNGDIMRPLLCVGRNDIEAYLSEIGQDYVTDSSNLVDNVVRNKIRLNIIPALQSINPSVKESIANTAEYMTDACLLVDNAVAYYKSKLFADNKVDVSQLLDTPSAEYVLFMLLNEFGFVSAQVSDVFSACSSQPSNNGRIWSSGSHDLLLDRGFLIVKKHEPHPFNGMTIPEPGTYVIGNTQKKLKIATETVGVGFVLSKEPDCICVDSEKVKFPLMLRLTEPGDKFVPLGMHGHKLVSDFLTDRKRSLFEKKAQLVLTSANGNIIWLVGERVDGRVKVTAATTSVLRISLL